jgi:hypothetical protein
MVMEPGWAEDGNIRMKEAYDESYDTNSREGWREQDSFGLAIEGP